VIPKARYLGVALAVALLCIGTASSATAAPRAFYGVIAEAERGPDSAEIARMGAGGVGTLRINLVWGAVQPTPGAPLDWLLYDRLIGDAAANGIRVLPTVYSSPAWAAARPNHPPARSHMDEFAAFVKAAVQRYGSNGEYWSTHPWFPKLPITNWQLWNEVNSPSFWYAKPSAKQYVSLLRVFSRGIKSADPAAKVVLAGLFRRPNLRNGVPLKRYLPAIYRHKGKRLFDAVAVHPYAKNPHVALDAVRETRRIMAQFKDRRARVWITEIGWATGGNPPTPLTVSPARQANYLRKTYRLMAANRKRLGIAGVVWYSWRDAPGGGIWIAYTGLFTVDLSPKPAWSAFVGLTGGTP
jgi:polysaccharide biosynthesis protein PslG